MKYFASTVSESVKLLGQSFIVGYYLPALAFVLVHNYTLVPIWTGTLAAFSITVGGADLVSLLGVLLVSLVVAIVLVGFNDFLIKAFEGKVWWLRQGLLYPLTQLNRRRCERTYGNLVGLQKEHRRVSSLLVQAQSPEERERLGQQVAGLAQQIHKEHKEIERRHPYQTLPHDVDRVSPTAFGNAYAIAEEYAYERYGIDSVLFWLRLRALMQDVSPAHSARIASQKMSLDLLLNLSFVAGLLVVETISTLVFGPDGHGNLLIPLALVAAGFSVGFYSASVGAVRTMGELIKISFDYHRALILEALGLQMPDDLVVEQVTWVRLAAFIRRGDEFYFPVEARKAESAETAKEISANSAAPQ